MTTPTEVFPTWRPLFANALFKFSCGLDMLSYVSERDGSFQPELLGRYFDVLLQYIEAYDVLLGWGLSQPENTANMSVTNIADTTNTTNTFKIGDAEIVTLKSIRTVMLELFAAMRCNKDPVQVRLDGTTAEKISSLSNYTSSTVTEFAARFNAFLMPESAQISVTGRAESDDDAFWFTFATPDVRQIVLSCETTPPPDDANTLMVRGSRIVGGSVALERDLRFDLSSLSFSDATVRGTDAWLIAAIKTLTEGDSTGFRLNLHADLAGDTALQPSDPMLAKLHSNYIDLVLAQRPYCKQPMPETRPKTAAPVATVAAQPSAEPAEPVAPVVAQPSAEPAEPVAPVVAEPSEEPAEPVAPVVAEPSEEPAEPVVAEPSAETEAAEPSSEPASQASQTESPTSASDIAPTVDTIDGWLVNLKSICSDYSNAVLTNNATKRSAMIEASEPITTAISKAYGSEFSDKMVIGQGDDTIIGNCGKAIEFLEEKLLS
jgi:hypothetical protein